MGSSLKIDAAYVDHAAGQALCVWDAPDRASVEQLFAKAGLRPESIREVTVYRARLLDQEQVDVPRGGVGAGDDFERDAGAARGRVDVDAAAFH